MKREFDPGRGKLFERTAKEAKRYRVWKKVLTALLGCIVILLSIVYIASLLYHKFGSLTVSVNRFDANKYALTISETDTFDYRSARVNCRAAEEVTNISKYDLPNNLDSINGEHNGDNYVAYTYYVRNEGEYTLTYEYHLYIANVKNEIDKAIRFRVFVDGVPTDYALTRTDGGGAEPGTEEFLTRSSVCRKQISHFKPGDVTKYTVVIWLEGDDPDCTDDLIGGQLKADMVISVIESSLSE